MALTPKQRDQRRREKQERLGEQDLRLKVTTTHASQLADLMYWGKMVESGEALTLLIYNAHKLGRSKFPYFAAGASLEIEATSTSRQIEPKSGLWQGVEPSSNWMKWVSGSTSPTEAVSSDC